MTPAATRRARRAPRPVARIALAALWLAAIAALLALGTWQVHRRAWKLALIARVDAGMQAPPMPAPASARPEDAYRRVVATGTFLAGHDSFVQATTVRGPGWWVLTPLRTDTGRVILINRGYVPHRIAAPPDAGAVTVTGLLRLTEPKGGFLRSNDPAADRWHSRDVAAIAARRGIGPVAPYFIDAAAGRDAAAGSDRRPIGGLTVVRFPNNHLVYAITWYMLAAMSAAGFLCWIGVGRRRRPPRA